MKIRLVIDTNLWISYLIGGELSQLESVIERPDVTLLFSGALLEELVEVASRPKFERYFDSDDLKQLIYLLDRLGELIDVNSSVSVCRNPKDNFLLALAVDGKADFLITGDSDLLEIKLFGKTGIISFSYFISQIIR